MFQEPEGIHVKQPSKTPDFDTQVDRNLKGKELAQQGKLKEAEKLYLANVQEEFEGNHPYDRLAVMYRKEKAYEKEIEVLEQAVYVFENKVNKQRPDREKKLNRFKERLENVKQLANQ